MNGINHFIHRIRGYFSALAPSHPPEYRRHRPDASLLYQVIEEYWPEFQAELAALAHPCATRHRDILTNGRQGKHLLTFICREFDHRQHS